MDPSGSGVVTEKRKRRWLQFSLTTLFLAVLLLSLPLSWLVVRMERARRRTEAVERITELGGSVSYDYTQAGEQRPAPAWLCRLTVSVGRLVANEESAPELGQLVDDPRSRAAHRKPLELLPAGVENAGVRMCPMYVQSNKVLADFGLLRSSGSES